MSPCWTWPEPVRRAGPHRHAMPLPQLTNHNMDAAAVHRYRYQLAEGTGTTTLGEWDTFEAPDGPEGI